MTALTNKFLPLKPKEPSTHRHLTLVSNLSPTQKRLLDENKAAARDALLSIKLLLAQRPE